MKDDRILKQRQQQWLILVKQIYDNAPTRKDQIALKWMLWLASFFNMTHDDRIEWLHNAEEMTKTFDRLIRNIHEYRKIRAASDHRAAPTNKSSSRGTLPSSASQSRRTCVGHGAKASDYQKASRDPRVNTVPMSNIKHKGGEVKS